MKASILALISVAGASLFSSALADELVERAACNAPLIVSGIGKIQSAILKLDNDFKNIKSTDGSDINYSALLSDSSAIISTINNQTASIKGCSPILDQCGAAQVQLPVFALLDAVSALKNDLIAKKVPISAKSLQGIIRNQASSQKAAADSFGAVLKAIVPGCLTTIAVADISIIDRVIQSIISTFS